MTSRSAPDPRTQTSDPPMVGRRPSWTLLAALLLSVVALACADGSLLEPGSDGSRGQPEADPSLEALVVSPDSARLEPGETREFTARGRNAEGQTVEVDVEWAATGGTIDSAGLYTAGEEPGEHRVTAEHSSGLTGDAALTIDEGGSSSTSPSSAAECDSPARTWIWCDDFEQDRLDRYFEYDDAGGAFVRAAGVGWDGSVGMRARFAEGQTSVGSLHLAFGATPDPYFDPVDDGVAKRRELYWRVYVKHESGWTGGGGDKLSRATILADTNWAQAMIAHVWSGSGDPAHDYLVVDPASGTDPDGTLITTTYNDFDNLRWLGSERGDLPLFDAAHVGEWYCVEAHVRLNDPGAANGVFELWIDGRLDAARTGLGWVGAYDDYGLNAVFLENYWNAGSPRAQERYFDNFVVSTERIGC